MREHQARRLDRPDPTGNGSVTANRRNSPIPHDEWKESTGIPRLLLTPEEAATVMAVSRTKLYELLRIGAIESVRIGGSRRIPADALETFVSRLRTESAGYVT